MSSKPYDPAGYDPNDDNGEFPADYGSRDERADRERDERREWRRQATRSRARRYNDDILPGDGLYDHEEP